LPQWEKVTSYGSDFHQIMTRVKAKPWTGSPEEEDFVRAVTAIRNRSCEFNNHQRVLHTASYPIGKTFPFVDAYHFLVAQNYFVAKPQQEFPATFWNAASCVRYNERVGQCQNTPLLTIVTSTADELTSFVYSALLLGCRVSVSVDNRGI
jgi:hypothetical protein